MKPLVEQIARLHRRAQREALRQNLFLLPMVTVGSPGRHSRRGRQWVITPGTARNLSRWKGEFDGVPLEQLLSRRLGVPVLLRNDAAAQMAYGIREKLRSPGSAKILKGRRVGFLGLGTGLGGGFASVSQGGRVVVNTDGHVGNMLVEPFEFMERRKGYHFRAKVERRWVKVNFHAGTSRPTRNFRLSWGRPVEVQDLFSGSGVQRLRREMGVGLSSETLARFEGEIMFRLIDALHRGRVFKAQPWLKWSKADRRFVRRVGVYLLGGGLVDQKPFLVKMIGKFHERWEEMWNTKIEILTIRNSAWAGAMGTVDFIDPRLWRRAVASLP